jgi:heme exporter protein B
MLPTLVYPMLVPALVGAIQLSRVLIVGGPLAENLIWFRILVAFNVIFTVLALALVEIVLVG